MINNEKGLTLLELLIAITLMSVLSITTTQMIRKSTVQTKKITSGIDNISQLRAAMNIVKKDVAKAINYRDLNLFLYSEAQEERAKRYDARVKKWVEDYNKKKKPNTKVTFETLNETQKESMLKDLGPRPKPVAKIVEKIYTHFVADSNKLYFTSTSGVRFRSADKVSDLVEVGYFLRTCKSRKYKDYESKCLWRSVSYNLDEDVTQGGTESVLIENVENAEFKYLSFQTEDISKETADWVESWDSRTQGDKRTGGNFPAAISLSLEIKIPDKKDPDKSKAERLTGFFQTDFVNNQPFEKIKASQTSTATSNVNKL
ncbi:MAG: type II secretion system protein GspJ [Bdellovibrionales bacterium]